MRASTAKASVQRRLFAAGYADNNLVSLAIFVRCGKVTEQHGLELVQ